MNVVVLGGQGMIGSRLVPLLRGGGIGVRTAGRSPQSDVAFDWDGDLRDAAVFDGCDALFLVPPALVAEPAARVVTFLETARRAGVTRVVAASSLGVTFPTELPDSGRHRYESAVSAAGIDWTILQPAGFMQNFTEGFMAPMVAAGTVLSSTGSGQSAVIDAGDIAAVAAVALTGVGLVGRRLRLTGPELMDSAAMVQVVSAATHRPIRHELVGEAQMAEMMAAGGIPDDYVAVLLRDQRAIRDGHAALLSEDVADVLGRPPRSLAAVLSDDAGARS